MQDINIDNLSTKVNFIKRGGLCPVIVQEKKSNEILMLGYTNKIALEDTISSGYASFWSTSKNALWKKGETSGNRLQVINILLDCDSDALIYLVTLEGQGACHTKNEKNEYRKSCFYKNISL